MAHITTGAIAKRIREITTEGADPSQFDRELDAMTGIKTRPNGSRYIDPRAERVITATTHSWAHLGEAICGPDVMRRLRETPYGIRGGRARLAGTVFESGAMGPSQFAAINYWTDTIFRTLEAEMLAQFANPEFIGSQLTTLKPGQTRNSGLRGRYSPPTEEVQELTPNQEIPAGNFDSEFILENRLKKHGQRLAVAREACVFDGNQGSIVEACNKVAYQVAWKKEDRILKPVLGIHNTYKYGAANAGALTPYDTYQTSSPWINRATAELVDETDLDEAEQLFLGMTDPRTGYPINGSGPRTLLVMPYKLMTARRLQRITSVEQGARTTAPSAVEVTAPTWAGSSLNVVFSQRAYQLLQQEHNEAEAAGWVALTAAKAKQRWIYGDPAKAFEYREAWPFSPYRFTQQDDASLARNDTFMEVGGTEMGSVTVAEPRHVVSMIKDS